MDIFKVIIAFINLPRILPHLLFFQKRKSLLIEDIIVNYRGRKYPHVIMYMLLLVFKKPFRNIVYHRMGKLSYCFKWMLPPYETFILDNQMIIGGGDLRRSLFCNRCKCQSGWEKFHSIPKCNSWRIQRW